MVDLILGNFSFYGMVPLHLLRINEHIFKYHLNSFLYKLNRQTDHFNYIIKSSDSILQTWPTLTSPASQGKQNIKLEPEKENWSEQRSWTRWTRWTRWTCWTTCCCLRAMQSNLPKSQVRLPGDRVCPALWPLEWFHWFLPRSLQVSVGRLYRISADRVPRKIRSRERSRSPSRPSPRFWASKLKIKHLQNIYFCEISLCKTQ